MPRGRCLFRGCQALLSQSVRGDDGRVELVRSHVRHHVVDGFALYAGFLGDDAYLFILCDANFLQSNRQTDLHAEILNLPELLLRSSLQHELDESAEGNAAAMGRAVSAKGGETIVEGVGYREAAVVSAHAGEIDIGLDDGFQGGSDHMALAGLPGGSPVFPQGVIAEAAQSHSGSGNASVFQAGSVCALAGPGLKIGAQGVAHTGYQELHRGVCDDLAVHDHGLRILWVEQVAVEGLVIVVNDRETGAGGIRSHHSGDDHHRQIFVVGSGLGCVDGGAAANANDDVESFLPCDLSHFFNLAYAGDPAEDLIVADILRPLKALLDFIVTHLMPASGADEEPAVSQILHLLVEMEKGVLALNIFLRCAHHSQSKHNKSSFATHKKCVKYLSISILIIAPRGAKARVKRLKKHQIFRKVCARLKTEERGRIDKQSIEAYDFTNTNSICGWRKTMSYRKMAEELLKIRSGWSHVAVNEELDRMTKGEFFVLNYLEEYGGTAFPKALSREMEVSTARVAALLKHMETKGWVTRAVDCEDNRQVIVSITPAGRNEINDKREKTLEDVTKLLEFLGPQDAEAFLRIQKKVIEGFKDRE